MTTCPRAIWIVLGLWCLGGPGVAGECVAPEGPVVNVYRGEINGTPLAALTADTLHSLFGPPSVLEEPATRPESQETVIHYHALGLSFAMRPSSVSARHQCWRVRLYLAEIWDSQAGRFFLPFAGRLSKQVGQDWTPERIATEFRQWEPHQYAETQVDALVREPPMALGAPDAYRVLYLTFTDFHVDFFYHHPAHLLQAMQLTWHRTGSPAPR
jgi:hypothetical protein